MIVRKVLFIVASTIPFFCSTPASVADQPNIVIIMADDMGFGDVQALNDNSRIATPHLNRFASEGASFLDAHSPSGVCTPTRYSLITGRYSWRTPRKSGVLGGYSKPMLEPDRATIASMLKQHGYRTGAIGKWHLGMALPLLHTDGDTERWNGDPGVDFAGVINDSPIHHGFDYYFGITASLDMGPYVYVRNDRFVSLPTLQQSNVNFPHFVRQGPRSEDFVIDQCLDRIKEEAKTFIQKNFADDQPCFLYLPLTAPHKPTQPKAEFKGKTGLGDYGDFIAQVDDAIGQVLTAIDDSGEADNTLVIITSDNGSYMFRYDDANQKDHTDDDTIQGYRSTTHTANGPWRGTKADIYEAGHHVPFFARWPGKIAPETKINATICHVDLFATCAAVVGHTLEENEAEDSFSWLDAAKGDSWTRPAPVIHQSGNGTLAIRDGKWKLIASDGSGGREKPVGKPDEGPFRLFNMESDPGEATDVAATNIKLVEQLTSALNRLRESGSRSQIVALHSWHSINYPDLPCEYGDKTAHPSIQTYNREVRGLKFRLAFAWNDALEKAGSIVLPDGTKITVKLHMTDGTIIDPISTTFDEPFPSFGRMGFSYGNFNCVFPWGENEMQEAWIKLDFPDHCYWLEIPYGFTRDPIMHELPTSKAGPPKFAPNMEPFPDSAKIVNWTTVNYNLGTIQNDWRLYLLHSNPFDAHSEIGLRRVDGKTWDLHSPRTRIEVRHMIEGSCVSLRLDESGSVRRDDFDYNRFGGADDERDWGTIVISVDDQDYETIIPSSLYRYVHGVAEPFHRSTLGLFQK